MAARANVNYYTIDPRGLVGMTNEFMEMAGGGVARAGRRCPRCARPARTPRSPASRGSVQRPDRIHERADDVAGQPARARRTDRRHRVGQHELADQRLQPHRARPTAATTCSAITRRRTRATADSTRSKCASKRPGLRVAARKGYGSPRGRTAEERKRDEEARRAREAQRPNADKTSAELRDILTSPLQQSGLNFTVQAAPFKNTQKEASVALAIEIDGDRLQYSAPDAKGH